VKIPEIIPHIQGLSISSFTFSGLRPEFVYFALSGLNQTGAALPLLTIFSENAREHSLQFQSKRIKKTVDIDLRNLLC